jgi:hypothetical protein
VEQVEMGDEVTKKAEMKGTPFHQSHDDPNDKDAVQCVSKMKIISDLALVMFIRMGLDL